jgi:hypothetical protein
MQIQLNTDHHIQGNEAMEARVDSLITQHLERFFPYLTRIEVHLADTNGGKGGGQDKQCAIEARISNRWRKPFTVPAKRCAPCSTAASSKSADIEPTRGRRQSIDLAHSVPFSHVLVFILDRSDQHIKHPCKPRDEKYC